MILSGPELALGIENSLRMRAAFCASDFRLVGMGVLTMVLILLHIFSFYIYKNK